mmetsp:Transcript_26812/g.66729  ORF Transcript_26812/g.66729 Transcript_26812/m.66729 type:complete len:85 (+) Transcript_26812:80-334(+)
MKVVIQVSFVRSTHASTHPSTHPSIHPSIHTSTHRCQLVQQDTRTSHSNLDVHNSCSCSSDSHKDDIDEELGNFPCIHQPSVIE